MIEPESLPTLSSSYLPLLQPHENDVVAKAVNDFLSQWINPGVELWWDILHPDILTSLHPFEGECLSTALQAVSVMAVASRTGFQNQDLLRVAAKMYGSALRLINLALQSPVQCLQDNTILAVTLTALFESMQENVDDSLTAAHLRGMMSMINARGPSQFQTITGRRIFIYAYFGWTSSAMPDMAVMPERANDFVPSFSEEITTILAQPISDEPAFKLLPLVQKRILLRSTTIPLLQTASDACDPNVPLSILSDIGILNSEFLAWNASLLPSWGEEDHLYQLLITSWFRTHRVFLADLAIRCFQLLAEIEGKEQDEQIWKRIDQAQNAIDEICVRTPYGFGEDKHELRRPNVSPRTIPTANLTYLYHSSFDCPLLVASMVWTLPQFRQKGIDRARMECARACGLSQPRKRYPKALVCVSKEERERYIQHRVKRHQKWVKDRGGQCPFRDLPGQNCDH